MQQDLSAAIAQAGIVRTKDLKIGASTQLKDQVSSTNVVYLIVDGKYAFYTRPGMIL